MSSQCHFLFLFLGGAMLGVQIRAWYIPGKFRSRLVFKHSLRILCSWITATKLLRCLKESQGLIEGMAPKGSPILSTLHVSVGCLTASSLQPPTSFSISHSPLMPSRSHLKRTSHLLIITLLVCLHLHPSPLLSLLCSDLSLLTSRG